jgi:hypothetical protein
MTWQIDNLTLDGDKVTEKVGNISLSFPNAYLTETYTHPGVRFPIGTGTAQQQLTALVDQAEAGKTAWVARRTAEDNLKTTVLAALNP